MLSRAEEIACRGSRSDFHFWRTDASPLEKAPNRKGREGLGKGAKTTIAVADDITTSENTEDHWRLGRAGHSPRVRRSAWAGNSCFAAGRDNLWFAKVDKKPAKLRRTLLPTLTTALKYLVGIDFASYSPHPDDASLAVQETA